FVPGATQPWFPVPGSASFRSCSEPARSSGFVANSSQPSTLWRLRRDCGSIVDRCKLARGTPVAAACPETTCLSHPAASSEGLSHASSSFQLSQRTYSPEAVSRESQFCAASPRAQELLQSAVSASPHFAEDRAFPSSPDRRAELSPHCVPCAVEARLGGVVLPATKARTEEPPLNVSVDTNASNDVFGEGHVPGCSLPQSQRGSDGSKNSHGSGPQGTGTPMLSPLSEHSPEDTVPVCTGGHNGGVVPLSLTSFAEPGAAWVTAVRRQHAAASGAAAASGKSRNSKTQPGGGSVPSLYLEPPYSSSTPPPPIPNRTSRHIASFGTGYLSSSPTVERPSSPISFGVDRSPPCANMGNRTSSCSPYLRHPGEELSTDVTRSHTGNDFQALIAPGSRDAFSSQAAFTRFPDETARESLPGTLVSSNTAGTTQIISELHATSGHASPRTPALSKSGCSSSRTSPSRSSSVDPTRGSASFLTGEPSTSRGARMRPVSPHRPATSLRLPSPLFTCKGRSQSPRCLTQTPSGEHDKEDCTPQKSVDSLWESQDGTRRSATQIRSRALSPAYQLAASPLLGSTTPIPSGVTTDVAPAMLTERAPVQINANEQSGLLTTWEEAQGHPAPRLATPQSRHSETCDRHALPSPRGAQGRPASLHVSQTEGELGRATEAKNMTSYCSNSSAAQTLSAGSFASLAAAAAATSADAAVEWGGVSSAPQGSTCVLSSISSRDPGHAGDIDGRSHGLTSGGSSCGFISFDGLTVDLPTSRAPGSAPPDFPACEPDAGATPHATCEASETQGTAYQTCLSSCLDQGLPLGAATALSSRGSGRSALSHALSRRDGIGDSAFPPESDGLPSQAFSVCGASTLGSNGHRSPAVTSRGSVSPAKSVAGTGRAASTPRMSPRCRAPRCLSTPCSRSASRGTGRVRSPLSPRPEPIPDPSPSSHPALSDPGYSGQQETAQGVTSTRPSAAAHNAEGRSPTTFSPGGRSPMRRASVHTPAREQSLTPLEAPVELGHDLQTQSPKKVGASSPFVFRLDTPALSSVSSSATGRVSVASPARRLPRGGDRSSRNLGGASPSPLVTTGGSAGSSPRRPRASSPTFFSNRSGGSASPASSFAATARSAASGSPFARLGASRLGTPKMGTGYASLGASPAAPVGAWTPFRANLFSPGSAVQPTPVPYSPIDAISPFNGSCAAQLKSPRSANAVLGGRRSQSPSASAIGPSPSRPSPSKGDSVGFPMRTGAPGHLPLLAPLFGAHSPSPPSAGGAASRGSRDPGRHLGSSPQRPSSPFVQRGSPFFPSPSASPHNGDSPLIQRHGDMAPSCRTDRIGAEEANLSPSSGRDAKHPSRGNISPTTAAEAVAAAAAAAATLHSAEAVNAADEAHKTGDLAASSAALQVPGTASGVVGNQHNVFHDISAVPFRPHHASHTGKAFSPPSPSTPEKGAVDLRASTASVHTPLATSQSGEAPPPDVLPSLSPVAAAAASALPPETSALVLGHVFPNQITPNVRSDMALSRSSPFLTPRAAAAAARIRAEAAAAAAMAAAERAAAAARSSVSPRAVDASRRAADAAAHAVAAARRCASTSPRIAAASERAAAAIAAAAAASAAAAGSAKDLAEARRRAVPVAAAAAAVAAARQRAASTAAAAFPALNESVTRRESLSPAAGAKHIHMRAGAAATKAHEARMWKGRLPSGRAVFIKKIPAAVWEQQWRLTQRYKGFFLTDGENFVGEAAFSAFLTDFGPPCAAPLLAVLHEDGNGLEGIHGSHGESEVPEPASSTSRVVLVNQGFGQGDLLDFFDNADPEVFTPASKRSLQYSVTQILVALHSAGIAHLDLTPENILVHAYTEALPSSITPQAGFGLSARGSCGSSTTPSAKLSGGSARRVQLKVCDLAKAAPLFNHSPFRLPPCILKAHFGDCGPENSVASSAAQPFLSCEPTVAKGPYMPPECWRIVYILRALGITAPFAQIGEPLLTTGRPPPPLYLKDPPQPGAPLLGPLREPIDLSVGVDAAELFFDVRKADIYMLGVLMFWIWAEGAIWTCSDPRQDTQYNDLLQCGLEFSIFTDCDGWPPELRHLLKGALDPDPTRRVTLAEILQHPWWTCSLSATGLESAPIS
ncbi:putative FIK kinase (incomplete catalytic triad), partial [Neospora caninum Liverpool]